MRKETQRLITDSEAPSEEQTYFSQYCCEEEQFLWLLDHFRMMHHGAEAERFKSITHLVTCRIHDA